jgi:ATP-dependent DNA helicase RecG
MTARELLELLNTTDELDYIEAKQSRKLGKSVLETVCAYVNTPGIGSGFILCGVTNDQQSLFPAYTVSGIENPDQFQSDLATQCATLFNRPIRPNISVEIIGGLAVVVITVEEAGAGMKPLFFKAQGLPRGAYIRSGSTDQRCTEEDLEAFYSDREFYDASFVDRTSMEDIDPDALARYRTLRRNTNPEAIELTLSDQELLLSLNCLADDGSQRLTVTGLLVFGKSTSLRRKFPMQRVDYIRVPGNQWMADPDNRFSSVDMRGSLISLAFRAVDAMYSDLPKQFALEEGAIQAQSRTIPAQALREAVVNALMHRNYRVSGPIQLIRYDNRIEIINPGFSLKPESQLGEMGSRLRNPSIAAIFHETNLAETKGSGIRVMRQLMKAGEFAPPTFFSNRENNQFTSRLLLHHFLQAEDLRWLERFKTFDLNAEQKLALVFAREVGAIDNSTYRQLSDVPLQKAGQDLRRLRQVNLLEKHGKTRATYYTLVETSSKTKKATLDPQMFDGEGQMFDAGTQMLDGEGQMLDADAQMLDGEGQMLDGVKTKIKTLPVGLQEQIASLGPKATSSKLMENLIWELCKHDNWTLNELSQALKRDNVALHQRYIRPMLKQGKLNYTIPDMIKHPKQAYRATENDK